MIGKKEYSYGAKVMLVGEYGVILGGSALTIPFGKYHATVRTTDHIPPGSETRATESGKYLKDLHSYILSIDKDVFHAKPDLKLFQAELQRYWLEMSIPQGYGLGSSGAVSAAIYDLFFPGSRSCSLLQQKEDLAAIESYFHGKSSGVDALTCYTGSPLYFQSDGTIQRVEFHPARLPMGYRFFLLDSNERFDTGPLVNHFLQQMKNSGFATSIRGEYMTINQKLIDALLGNIDADPGLLVRVLSDFQYTHFRKMIPSNMLDFWIEGQVSNEYYLKLNGSGGGFMLGITHHSSMEALENRWKKALIWIDE